MRIAITGGTGLIGSRLAARLRERGEDVRTLSLRSDELAPKLEGRDAVVHLAGENLAQRWTAKAKREILESREQGTRRLVAALPASVRTLVSASAVGYYGARGAEEVTEDDPPGDDFPARVCVAWEREANATDARVVTVRTGVVLDASGGALAKMLLPFRLGVGGPVAGGRQYMAWIHIDDLVGIYVAALDGDGWRGPVNATAPNPVTNAEFSKALGRALHRPAVLPIPALALRALYGEMAIIVTTGQRAIPRAAQANGYEFAHPEVEKALANALQ